jgi:hypothetical protein
MTQLTASVGQGGENRQNDVKTVQTLLNLPGNRPATQPVLRVTGHMDDETLAAILRFQDKQMRMAMPDSRVDPGGRTWRALNRTAVGELSGASWWHAHQAEFPNSAAVSDLEPTFSAKVTRFLAALRAAGATVTVSATRRNKIRAYLMHHSWRVAHQDLRAADVPAEPGCNIVWDHGDDARSRRAAQEMVDLFGIVFKPSLTSRHILGLAIDMSISWTGTLALKDTQGKTVNLASPRDGSHTGLHTVGAGYGVVKLLSDPPHWSDNGH